MSLTIVEGGKAKELPPNFTKPTFEQFIADGKTRIHFSLVQVLVANGAPAQIIDGFLNQFWSIYNDEDAQQEGLRQLYNATFPDDPEPHKIEIIRI